MVWFIGIQSCQQIRYIKSFYDYFSSFTDGGRFLVNLNNFWLLQASCLTFSLEDNGEWEESNQQRWEESNPQRWEAKDFEAKIVNNPTMDAPYRVKNFTWYWKVLLKWLYLVYCVIKIIMKHGTELKITFDIKWS